MNIYFMTKASFLLGNKNEIVSFYLMCLLIQLSSEIAFQKGICLSLILQNLLNHVLLQVIAFFCISQKPERLTFRSRLHAGLSYIPGRNDKKYMNIQPFCLSNNFYSIKYAKLATCFTNMGWVHRGVGETPVGELLSILRVENPCSGL